MTENDSLKHVFSQYFTKTEVSVHFIQVSYCYVLVLNSDFKTYLSPWILLQAHLQVHHVCFTFTSCHKSIVFRTLTDASVPTLNIINKKPINISKDFEIHIIVIYNASKG